MLTQHDIDVRFLAQRFDDWTIDWTLPYLFWALLNLPPATAWLSSFAVALVVGEARWFVYPARLWSSTLLDMALTLGRWLIGGWVAYELWEADRRIESIALLATLAFFRVIYQILVLVVSDARRGRKYRTHHHNVFFQRFF